MVTPDPQFIAPVAAHAQQAGAMVPIVLRAAAAALGLHGELGRYLTMIGRVRSNPWAKLEATVCALDRAEQLVRVLRDERDRQIVTLASSGGTGYKKIARSSGKSVSYVSRVARDGGAPQRAHRDDRLGTCPLPERE